MPEVRTIVMTCEICERTATVEDGPHPEGFHGVRGHIVCYPECFEKLQQKLRQKQEDEIVDAISAIKNEL